MRKDLWIGGIAATVAHSAAIWFSLFQTHPPATAPVGIAETALVMIAPPPIPDEVEVSEEIVDRPPPSPSAPSLADLPSPNPTDIFVQPLQPNPPGPANETVRVIPPQGAFAGPEGPPTFNLHDLSQPPVPTATPRPQYPFAMRSAGIEGTVMVDFIVDEHGVVQHVIALEGPTNEFKVAAVESLRRWRFRPGIKDGRAVRTHMQIPLVFSLQR